MFHYMIEAYGFPRTAVTILNLVVNTNTFKGITMITLKSV